MENMFLRLMKVLVLTDTKRERGFSTNGLQSVFTDPFETCPQYGNKAYRMACSLGRGDCDTDEPTQVKEFRGMIGPTPPIGQRWKHGPHFSLENRL